MNKTVVYRATVTHGSTGVPVAVEIPVKPSEGMAFRLRRVVFQLASAPSADTAVLWALSKNNSELAKASLAIYRASQWIAVAGIQVQFGGASGAEGGVLGVSVDLWDHDYRLPMSPTFHTVAIGQLFANDVYLWGEMVPMSRGARNAAIAYQGGLFDA